MIEWTLLTACQTVHIYFMLTCNGITPIVRSYLFFVQFYLDEFYFTRRQMEYEYILNGSVWPIDRT